MRGKSLYTVISELQESVNAIDLRTKVLEKTENVTEDSATMRGTPLHQIVHLLENKLNDINERINVLESGDEKRELFKSQIVSFC